MPRYELMYILSSSVSDEQLPEVASQVLQFISDFGGTEISENQLGKKKLAYPIKKTRNGFYAVVNFNMPSSKLSALDAKLRTQANTIIRYLLINIDEHLERLVKDSKIQAEMNRNRPQVTEPEATESKPKTAKKATETDINIDDEIEKALSEDISK